MKLDQQRPFGRTGVAVTPLAIGTGSWGPRRKDETQEDAERRLADIADRFFSGRLETNLIDTSNMYGEALSEPTIGAAIARAGGVPSGLVVQTKLDRDMSDDRFDGDRMWDSVHESLDRLGVDRLQVLYLHDPEVIGFEAAMRPGGAVEAIVEMKKQGLTDAIGISGGPVDMLQRFVETDLFDALVTHNRWTLLDRSADSLLDAAASRDLGVTNGAPYGAGVLTGDPRFQGSYGYKPIHPLTQRALDGIAAVCREAGVPLAAAAIQFSMRDPRVHSSIVGVSGLARWEEAVAFAEVDIPAGFWNAIDEHVPPAEVALDRI
ncbi:aldo/keto reductase [Leifsonia sp. NPDC058230]|uniref:aldo/keto reductase n=1 Tax=Leifsonia sp. NPDC058230 TaxID=3346391 RepID=UPI0036DAB92D